MDYITFYNNRGKAIAYLSEKDDETIYTFEGIPVAWLYGDCVYSFSGYHLGWYEDGWIFDTDGYRIFYTQYATGGPVKPVMQVRPVRQVQRVKPVKGVRRVAFIHVVKMMTWGDSDNFF